jgi:hypothetical protein
MTRRLLSGLLAACSWACGVEGASKQAVSTANPVASAVSVGTLSVAPGTSFVAPRPSSGERLAVEAPSPGSPARFLIVGGGPVPERNEVSLEQDVAMVQGALRGPGVVLFAGGEGLESVRELAPDVGGDALKTELGDLFLPRPGRTSRYRAPRFPAKPATLSDVDKALSSALEHGTEPLLLYIAGHGDKGETPERNSVALWGRRALTVEQLATWHEQHARPMRLVATTCFSGGFGDLAFAGARATNPRPSPVARCGVFAGTHDRESSGCDPNPSRRAQESYALHLVNAFSGQNKEGTRLPVEELDFDRDGKIGLLDAHTWARIQAVSFDLPTTTSERWLRAVETGSSPIASDFLPEDHAVIERLGASLGLKTEAHARSGWEQLDERIAALEKELDGVDEQYATAEDELMTALLERWPVIDDPFHPAFDASFVANRDAIAALLLDSELARKRVSAKRDMDTLYGRFDQLVVAEARVLRLLRSYETLHKAAALRRRGGSDARHYETLLACERAPLE